MINPSLFSDIAESDLEILPLERSETIPAAWYIETRFHDLENEIIFSRTWQAITHAARVQRKGDQSVGMVAQNPIIVVRGEDEKLRAFYNVCRHRGGPLALENCNSNVLQCKYHGWTYLLDGSLRGTPRFNRTELFDRKDYGLVPVRLEQWEGLVFVNLAEHALPLESVVKGISQRLSPGSLRSKHFYRRVTYDVRCNWKVYIDNYLEGYHLPYVHPELFKLLDYYNYVTETFDYASLQWSPIKQTDNLYGKTDEPAFYFFIWPNCMLNILPGRLQTNLVIPTSQYTTTVIFDYYYDDVTSERSLKMIEEDIRYSDAVQREDIEICERVQRGLASRVYSKGRFSAECESGVHHFQSLLKKAYRSFLFP